MTRPWLEPADDLLRRHWPTLGSRVLAEALARSPLAIKQRARKLGLEHARAWTEDEDRKLRKHTSGKTAAEIASMLGRTEAAVHNRRKHLGVANTCFNWGSEQLNELKRLHADGWSDAEISQHFGYDRHSVGFVRRQHGLTDNALSERRRRRVAVKTKQQIAASGDASLGALRARRLREYAVENGWPADLRARSVQILDALWRLGPRTRRQLANDIGMPWHGSRRSLKSNDPEGSHLANLIKRGFVVQLGRVVTGEGRGRSVNLYQITPHAVELRLQTLERLKQEKNHERKKHDHQEARDPGERPRLDDADASGGDAVDSRGGHRADRQEAA